MRPTSPRMRLANVVVAACIVAGLLLARHTTLRASTAPSSRPTPPPHVVLTVTVEPASWQTVHTTLGVTGSIEARDELSVGAEVSGLRIEQVRVEERDFVTRGQVLARLDATILQAQLKQAEARLQGAQASLSKARQPNRPQDIDGLNAALLQARATVEQQDANLLQARATLQNDDANAARYRVLLRQGFVTVADAHNVFTLVARDRALVSAAADQVQAAEAGRLQAESRLQLARLGGSSQDVGVAAASVAEIEGEVEQLRAQIAQTVITAPDDGLIVKRDAHLGDITQGKPLFTMVRRNQLELRAQVAESELAHLLPQARVVVTGEGHTVVGRVWQVTPQVDDTTRLATVRIALPADSGYLPGMFVRGMVDEGATSVLTVPLVAVQGTPDAHFVLLNDHGTARRRGVTIGQPHGDQVEIATGLAAGDPVIVGGAAFLNDGDPVAVGKMYESSAAGPVGKAGPRAHRPPHSDG